MKNIQIDNTELMLLWQDREIVNELLDIRYYWENQENADILIEQSIIWAKDKVWQITQLSPRYFFNIKNGKKNYEKNMRHNIHRVRKDDNVNW